MTLYVRLVGPYMTLYGKGDINGHIEGLYLWHESC